MRRPGIALIVVASSLHCNVNADEARKDWLTSGLVEADASLLRSRPELVAGKYARMRESLYAYYRGTFGLYLRDIEAGAPIGQSSFTGADAYPIAVGDSHPENFGLLEAGDGTLAFEANDFDGADRYPFLWDLRRLTVGMVLAARLSNDDDDAQHDAVQGAQRDIARSAAHSYAVTIAAFANGETPLGRIDEGGGSPNIEDLFDRGLDDLASREELDELTLVEGESRRLKRGAVEEDDPNHLYVDLPESVRDALPDALERYRLSLVEPPPADHLIILDAAREFGSGVASWPRFRAVVLTRGETSSPDDDWILEVKEIGDAGAGGVLPPGVFFDSVPDRVLQTSRQLWARPDAERLWGTTTMLGLPIQVRREAEAHKSLRIARMVEAEGTPEALVDLAGRLGELVARMHASSDERFPGTSRAIADAVSDHAASFADEEASVAVTYADRVEADWVLFRQALDELGPTLGFQPSPEDAPSADVAALFGRPPPYVATPEGS